MALRFPRFTVRQLGLAALAANAVRPLDTKATAIPAFVGGWLAGELAPHLLALGASDTAVASLRGRTTKLGLVAAGVSLAGFGYVIQRSRGSAAIVEQALLDGIGDDYVSALGQPPTPEDLTTPALQLARPFKMSIPGVEVIRDINYTEGGKRARLDIYRPEGVDLHDAPVLIQVHGGGWTIGTKEEQGQLLMNRMASRGWVCVAVNYRLSPKHAWPTHIIDVKRAIAWVRSNIASYGGDPSYLAITGGSAGGHLAALAALTPGEKELQPGFEDADTHVSAAVPFYGVYDMEGADGDPYTAGLRDAFLAKRVFKADPRADMTPFAKASPINHVTADAPDFFVLHGEYDTLVNVRQARAFVRKLRDVSDATVSYAELPGAQHAFEIFGSIRSHAAIKAAQRWLEWHWATHHDSPAAEAADSASPGDDVVPVA